jgi:hypothetical protein
MVAHSEPYAKGWSISKDVSLMAGHLLMAGGKSDGNRAKAWLFGRCGAFKNAG